jgi:hypothetical protein
MPFNVCAARAQICSPSHRRDACRAGGEGGRDPLGLTMIEARGPAKPADAKWFASTCDLPRVTAGTPEDGSAASGAPSGLRYADKRFPEAARRLMPEVQIRLD